MNQKVFKKSMCLIMAGALTIGSLYVGGDVKAAKKATLKTKKISVNVGQSKTIKIKNKNKKKTYTFTSNKKAVAKVSKKGKVTAIKEGTAKVTVKEKSKAGKKTKTRKLGVCKVTVNGSQDIVQITNVPVNTTPNPVQPTKTPDNPVIQPTENPTEEPPKATVVPAYYEKSLLDASSEYNGEAYFEMGDMMIYGGICEVSLKIKQESGSAKNVTVAYEGTYLSFKQNGAYIDKNSMNWNTPSSGSEEFSAESGVTEKTISFDVPKYSSDFNLIISCEGTFTIESLTVNTKPCKDADYAKMVGNSLRPAGNNARIKKAIEKAKAGEDVTLAYLGGSITEGFAASETKNSDCYAETSYREFKETFGAGDGSNVHFINAGMSGTPSSLGIIRYQRDVLDQMEYGDYPDILFIDFAVNDGDDGETYESIIRTALAQGSAVVLMFVLYVSGSGRESDYATIGENYDLMMVSPGSGQQAGATDKTAFDNWFYWSDGHPDVGGHRYMADCIMNMFYTVDSSDAADDNITDVLSMNTAKTRGNYYIGTKTLESTTDITKHPSVSELNAGGFNGNDDSQPVLQYIKDGVEGMKWFPNEWAHTSSSGNESLTAKIKCNSLLIAYKQAGGGFGKAEVYVDGKLAKTLSNTSGGWNNAVIEKVIASETVAEHDIEIKMAAGDESKPFTIYAIGYSNKDEFVESLNK